MGKMSEAEREEYRQRARAAGLVSSPRTPFSETIDMLLAWRVEEHPCTFISCPYTPMSISSGNNAVQMILVDCS